MASPTVRDRVLDALERAFSSAAEQFLAVVMLATTGASLALLPWKPALSFAAGAFLVSILLTVLQNLTGMVGLPFALGTAVRVVKTFVASLIGSLGSDSLDIVHVSWSQVLNLAAVASLLALVKCFLSPNAHLSGSLLPTPIVARLHGVTPPPGYASRG